MINIKAPACCQAGAFLYAYKCGFLTRESVRGRRRCAPLWGSAMSAPAGDGQRRAKRGEAARRRRLGEKRNEFRDTKLTAAGARIFSFCTTELFCHRFWFVKADFSSFDALLQKLTVFNVPEYRQTHLTENIADIFPINYCKLR